jgi:formamidopyrimidine-DNA glycosylase
VQLLEVGMPELPEVETMRRGIAPAVGMRVDLVEIPRGRLRPLLIEPPPKTFASQLRGSVLEAVDRYGKRLALRFRKSSAGASPRTSAAEGGVHWLVVEPRMTGLLLVADPPTQEHVRLRLRGGGPHGSELDLLFWDRRGLGTLRLVGADGLERLCGQACLGPDALAISVEALIAKLGASSRAVKVALLDQKVLAGVGNLYAAEILFRAGIDPRTRCQRLTRPRWKRLHAVMGEVLAEAIELEGSTLSDATYRTALNEPGRYQSRHRVYARSGQPCDVCGTEILRIVQAQRSTFFCRQCQVR